MKKKESRTEILYVRIRPSTMKLIEDLKTKLLYPTKSEFVDVHLHKALTLMDKICK